MESEPIKHVELPNYGPDVQVDYGLLALNKLPELIDRINDLSVALDVADTQNLLLAERVTKLEARYEGHEHTCYTNKDSSDPVIGNTGKPWVDDTPPENEQPPEKPRA